jgi:hypothetical protein
MSLLRIFIHFIKWANTVIRYLVKADFLRFMR